MGKYAVLAAIGIAMLIVLVFLKISLGKRAKNKALSVKAQDKLREEALDRVLLNESSGGQALETFSAKPFEVSYGEQGALPQAGGPAKKRGKSAQKLMVQISEKSELSVRKYMFDPGQGIRMGSGRGKNNIVVTDPQVDAQQCELLEHEGHVYVRNTGGSGKVTLVRGSQRAYVEKKAVEIKSGDEILLGNTVFKIELIKTGK